MRKPWTVILLVVAVGVVIYFVVQAKKKASAIQAPPVPRAVPGPAPGANVIALNSSQ